ncbi:hypothetical protein YWY31_33320 [Paenibacillus illinoisensis]
MNPPEVEEADDYRNKKMERKFEPFRQNGWKPGHKINIQQQGIYLFTRVTLNRFKKKAKK